MRGNNKTEVNLHFLSNSLYLEKNIILLKTKIKQQNKRESAKRHKHYFLVHWKLLCGLGICRNPFKRWVFIFLFVRFLFMFCSYTYLYSKRQQRLKLDVPAKKSKSYGSFSSWPDKYMYRTYTGFEKEHFIFNFSVWNNLFVYLQFFTKISMLKIKLQARCRWKKSVIC